MNMGICAITGEYLPWIIARDVPFTSPSHGNNSGAHGEPYSKHTHHFFRIVSVAEMEAALTPFPSCSAPSRTGFCTLP